MKTALVAGATGLIGSELLTLLLADPIYDKVIAITRKPLETSHPKLVNVVISFDELEASKQDIKGDDVFCCLGTTMKKAGSKEKFRKVDFEYPLALANVTLQMGASKFLLVSAMGAHRKSAFYYNQVKGEVEEAIGQVGYPAFHIFRPSLLLGKRDEHRSGEEAAKTFYKLFDFLIPKRIKGIHGRAVAAAMIHHAKTNSTGNFIHDSGSMQSFAT
jgi:uncharacterized protein YbjT (DUF2867 family)